MKDACAKKLIPLWGMFVVFAVLFCLNMFQMWTVLSIWTTGLSIFLLIKNKFPSKKYIITSVIFSLVASCVYLAKDFQISWSSYFTLVPTLFCCLAVFSVMEKYGDFAFFKNDTKSSVVKSIFIAICVGVVLGIINYFFCKANSEKDYYFSILRWIVAFNPAIFEEISCRAIFLAFIYYVYRGESLSKFGTFTMYFMMMIPHLLCHGYDIISALIVLILFSFPFTFLQKKRDIGSAMISHGIVDAIRFVYFGF